ncbi:MAG: hypothetical protein D6734_08365 [Candidatus Schekmanbacteria bacterium]|nr:MAG: hypothetical protein D6734_08365 [Candidatus Schekmanbacteria bacterium]
MLPHMKLDYNEILLKRFSELYLLEELEMEEDLKYKKVERDGITAENISKEYRCEKIKVIRIGELNAQGAVYVRNATIVCNDDYDIPIFAYDVVETEPWCFTTIDISPLRKTDEYRKKYVYPLKPIYEKYCNIPSIEKMRQELPDWAKELDSGFSFYANYDKKYEPQVREAFNDYLNLYLKFVKEAKPVEDESVRAELIEYKEHYKKVYKENDPGIGPTAAFFGKEWSERLFENFPF